MWLLVLGLFSCFLPHIVASVRAHRWQEKQDASSAWPYRKKGHRAPLLAPRPPPTTFFEARFHELFFILIAMQFALWTPQSVGVSTQVSWPLALAAGLLLYVIYHVGYGLVARSSDREQTKAEYLLFRTFVPRPRDREVFVLASFLNPVTEEFWYRGVLVYHLGALTGSIPVALAVGLAACVLVHLYQGRRYILHHVGF